MAESKGRILIIDDQQDHAEVASEALERVGYECVVAVKGRRGLELIRSEELDLVVTDLVIDDVDGMAILAEAKQRTPDLEVIMVTGHGSVKNAVEALQRGAASYLLKPLDLNELRAVADRSFEKQELKKANLQLRRQLDQKFGFQGIVGSNAKMKRVFDTLAQVSNTDATVMVSGESGTGKELIANAIHNNSSRKNQPFVALNCAALSESILESELFGHERGAFTGAEARRIGRFEYADGGTLFLDEVGDLPASTQVKLLRVVEQKQIVRVGSNESISVDVRLISATNRDLTELTEQGQFREDLYFRLAVVSMLLPALRERREDIPLLVEAFVQELSEQHGREITKVTPEAMSLLRRQNWPGNVRELRNCIESMVVVTTDGALDVDDIPEHIVKRDEPVAPLSALTGITIAEAERELMKNTLELVGGNRADAAAMLGIGERTLYRKLERYDLK